MKPETLRVLARRQTLLGTCFSYPYLRDAGVVTGVEELTDPDNLHKQMSKGSDTILNALFGLGRGESRDKP